MRLDQIFLGVAVRSPFVFFFFNDTATTEIYTLSLHDALPICLLRRRPPDLPRERRRARRVLDAALRLRAAVALPVGDRKSTRLNSSHDQISYAVFCLKKKKHTPHREPLVRLRTDAVPNHACQT